MRSVSSTATPTSRRRARSTQPARPLQPHRVGPNQAPGLWNCPTSASIVFSPSPAIANALYDAVGVIVADLPLTPERVLRAIREAENRPLDEESYGRGGA